MSVHNYAELEPGLYENVLDAVLQAQIDIDQDPKRFVTTRFTEDELPEAFSQYVATRLRHLLSAATKQEKRSLISSVMGALNSQPGLTELGALGLDIDNKLRINYLAEVKPHGDSAPLTRPLSRLSQANLITNAPHDPTLESELTSEFASADAVDAVVAFVRASSMRTLYKQLGILKDRGVPVRLITTTYTGATQRKVLDRLVREFGVQVKVSYNPERTRLHAKSWLIHRTTGFNTAYIGSSNLSKAAMQTGQEWNVRLSEANVPEVFSKFRSTFEAYWNSAEYETYHPDTDADRFDQAVRKARTYRNAIESGDKSLIAEYSLLQVDPYPHQKVMLNELAAERQSGHHRNLVVAATGTGKTVVAALDYKRLRADFEKQYGRSPRTLFIAHRQEILTHAHKTFVEVTKISDLGISTVSEFQLGSLDTRKLAQNGNLVFASIQSCHEQALKNLPADLFDFIIIDEFHHASASSYKRLLEHFHPQELLGLTATPERGDGKNVAVEFFDGRIATELRLWDAIEAELLVPFHYFVKYDGTDLSKVKFQRGEYDVDELNQVYVGNEQRADIVLQAINDKVPAPESMRALCFCVSIAHAEYMADCFNRAGLPAKSITAGTENRGDYIKQLQDGELRVICAVDIFNEGVDIPEVDTLLMLRPTQSSTVFLQQLGRGLRKSFGKDVLTVLDFVGNQRKEFRFDNKLRVFTGMSRGKLMESVEKGFKVLPAGVFIEFDKVSQEEVLKSLKANLKVKTARLAQELRDCAGSLDPQAINQVSLADFLAFTGRDPWEIYSRFVKNSASGDRVRLTFGRLKNLSVNNTVNDLEGTELSARISSFNHVTDTERFEAYKFLLVGEYSSYQALSERMKLYANMLVFNLWSNGKTEDRRFGSTDEAIRLARSYPDIAAEIVQLMAHSVENSRVAHRRPLGHLASYPLLLDAKYTRNELLAAFKMGFEFIPQKSGKFPVPSTVPSGVYYFGEEKTDVFMVTLQKSDSDIAYEDYAISEKLFHWQSQNTTSASSPTGKRYVSQAKHGGHVALFVREKSHDDYGDGAPYTFCGPINFISAEGSKPMSIVWELKQELSPQIYQAAKAVS